MPADNPANVDAYIRSFWKKNPEKLGSTLRSEKADIALLPLCAVCPSARWYKVSDKLKLYCREFHMEMPPAVDGKGVTMCDGYIFAINDQDRKG